MKIIPIKLPNINASIPCRLDDEDYELFVDFNWSLSSTRGVIRGYARRKVVRDGKQKNIYLHREIMGTPRGMETDHINHDTLDNRKENLRICTRQENAKNKQPGLKRKRKA